MTSIDQDPLAFHVVAGNVEKFLFAYRAITLIPVTPPSGRINLPAYSDSVVANVTEGPAGAKDLRIHAETIYIYAGSSFLFPGKTVTITARQIVLVPIAGVEEAQATINLTPLKAAAIQGLAEIGTSGQNAIGNTHANLEGGSNATPGGRGGPGTKGNAGSACGNFYLNVSSITSLLSDQSIRIRIKCAGGDGGDGQDGGGGGQSASGLLDKDSAHNYWSPASVANGSNAGVGGVGGDGGIGGHGGTAFCVMGTPNDSRQPDVDIPLDITKDGGTFGNFGKGGPKGTPGGRAGQFYRQYAVPGHNAGYSHIEKVTGTEGKGGQDGPDGGKGTSGDPGTIFQSSMWVCTTWPNAVLSRYGIIQPLTLDSVHMSMILQRLMFEYQLLYATQTNFTGGAQVQKDLEARRKNFTDSLLWLKANIYIFSDIICLDQNPGPAAIIATVRQQAKATQQKDILAQCDSLEQDKVKEWCDTSNQAARQNVVQNVQHFLAHMGSSTVLDYFGNTLTYIAKPSLELAEVSKSVGDLQALENYRNILYDAIAKENKKKDILISQVQQLTSVANTDGHQITQTLEAIRSQHMVVQQAHAQMDIDASDLEAKLQGFEKEIAYMINCTDIKNVVNAVTQCLMFAPEEMSPMFIAGSALSVGSATFPMFKNDPFTTLYTADGVIEKDALIGKVEAIPADVKEAQMAAQISSKQGILQEVDPAYTSMIAVSSSTFRQLVQSIQGSLSAKDERHAEAVEAAFDTLQHSSQSLHEAVIKYNSLAVQYTKLQRDQIAAQDNIASLQQQSSEISQPALDLLLTFFNQQCNSRKAQLIFMVYALIRNINCMTLSPSSIPDALFTLQSFDNITSDTLSGIFKAQVPQDLSQYHELRSVCKQSITFSKENSAHRLQTFQTDRRFTFTIDSDSAIEKPFYFNSDWYDIRVKDVAVVLVGATRSSATDIPSTKVISVHVEQGSLFTIVDASGTAHDWSADDRAFTYEYNYADAANGNYPSVGDTGISSLLTTFNIAGNDAEYGNYDLQVPLSGPLTKWTISVRNPDVDITNVSSVELTLTLLLRTRRGARLSSESSQHLNDHVNGSMPTKGSRIGDSPADQVNGRTRNANITKRINGPGIKDSHDLINGGRHTHGMLLSNGRHEIHHHRLTITKDHHGDLQFRYLPSKDLKAGQLGVGGQIIRNLMAKFNIGLDRTSAAGIFIGKKSADIFPTYKNVIPFGSGILPPFQNLGTDPGEMAKKIYANPRDPSVLKSLQDFTAFKNTAFKGLSRDDYNDTMLTAYRADGTGHSGFYSGMQKFDDPELARQLVQSGDMSKLQVAAFPGSGILIKPETAQTMLAASNTRQWVLDNMDKLLTESNEILLSKDSIIGKYAILGEMNLVKVHDIITTRTGDAVSQTMVMVTTSQHALDGVNLWQVEWHPDDPSLVRFSNILLGEHASRVFDAANVILGESLMTTLWASSKHIAQLQPGEDFDDKLLRLEPKLWRSRFLLELADRCGAKSSIALRKRFGANIAADPPVEQITAPRGGDTSEFIDDLPVTAFIDTHFTVTDEPAGLMIDDTFVIAADSIMPGDSSFAGTSDLNPISEADRAIISDKVHKTCMYEQGQRDIDELKENISAIVEKSMPGMDDDARRASDIYLEMLQATTAGVEIEKEVRRKLLNDAIPDVLDDLLDHPALAKYDQRDLARAVGDIGYKSTVHELDLPAGLIQLIAYQTIEPAVYKVVSDMDTAKQLEDSLKTQRDAQELADTAQAQRDKTAPEDPAYEEANERYMEACKALAEETEKVEKAQEMNEVKTDEQGRAEHREKKISDETDRHFGPEEKRALRSSRKAPRKMTLERRRTLARLRPYLCID